MGKQEKTRPYEADARELLKITDAIYDQGVTGGMAEGIKAKLANACGWKGSEIAKAFCAALTDANFHGERKDLAPHINRLFGTDIAKEG